MFKAVLFYNYYMDNSDTNSKLHNIHTQAGTETARSENLTNLIIKTS